jgi:subtilase family serine protease
VVAGNRPGSGGRDATNRQIVQGHLASVITNSYGDNAGDLLDTASDRQAWDSVLQMADATGISVLFSSGDNGDEFTTVGAVSPYYPATSPYATAVGDLRIAGRLHDLPGGELVADRRDP